MDRDKFPKSWQYSHRFSESQKKIESDCQRFDEMIDGALISIAKDPLVFPFVDEQKILQVCKARVITQDGDLKPITIFFTNHTEVIYLVDIIETPNGE